MVNLTTHLLIGMRQRDNIFGSQDGLSLSNDWQKIDLSFDKGWRHGWRESVYEMLLSTFNMDTGLTAKLVTRNSRSARQRHISSLLNMENITCIQKS